MMVNQDTIKLLRECDAGVKMGVSSIEDVLDNVKRYTRNGSIIVFHDSLRAERNLKYALPRAIEWLKEEGYEMLPIPM